ncbi:MAG: TatD family hydrolase [archaeon]|nr:TatD family hydrolase [archaeon]
MYVDVHCHLDMIDRPVEEVVENARKKNVKAIVTQGVNPANNWVVLKIAEKFKEVIPALGMYPLDCLNLKDEEIDAELDFIKKNKDKVFAIGEIGLDLKEDSREKGFEKQKDVFSKFVLLGIKLKKPIIVHSRKAELDVIEILESLEAKKVIMHCFSGKMKLVDRVVKNGWFLSIPANVKYSQQFQDVVKRVPIESLLCETDSPYLSPDKEFPNKPENVVESYKKIAEIKGLSLKKVEEIIEENFKKLFRYIAEDKI